jgi:hypothetical protein
LRTSTQLERERASVAKRFAEVTEMRERSMPDGEWPICDCGCKRSATWIVSSEFPKGAWRCPGQTESVLLAQRSARKTSDSVRVPDWVQRQKDEDSVVDREAVAKRLAALKKRVVEADKPKPKEPKPAPARHYPAPYRLG